MVTTQFRTNINSKFTYTIVPRLNFGKNLVFVQFFQIYFKNVRNHNRNSDNPITQNAVVTSNLNNAIVAKIK